MEGIPAREENTAHLLNQKIASLERRLAEAEQALWLAQQNMDRAQAVSHTGSWWLDTRQDALLWSAETYRMFGISKGSVLTYEDFLAAVHPDDRAFVDRCWTAAMQGQPYDVEHRIVVGDQVKWVHERAELEFDEQGVLLGGFGTVQDITARKRDEQVLRKLSRAVEQSPTSIVITDTRGRIEYVNPKFTQLTGYSLEEAIGQNPRVLKSGLTPVEVYQDLWNTIRAGQVWQGEFCNRTKYGELYYENASISPIKDEHGVVTHYVAVKEDITERKRDEQMLQDRSRRLAFLSEAAGELLRGNNPTALVETICDRLTCLAGIDLYLHFLVSPDGSRLDLAASSDLPAGDRAMIEQPEFGEAIRRNVLLTGRAIIAEDVQNSPEGRAAHMRSLGVSAYACYPLINQGRLIGTLSFGSRQVSRFDTETLSLFQAVCDLVAVAIDRKRAELALQDYAARLESSNRDLQEFAFVASHDLQEPLRKINAFGHLLLTRTDNLDEAQQNYLERMQGAASRMSRMVDDLLELARVNTQGRPFKPVNLSTVAANLLSDLEMQLQRTGGTVELGELPVIEADPAQMHQLLQNLVSNALKYHRPCTPPVVKVCAGQNSSGKVQILVTDNGIGFEEKYLKNIFQPFRRLVGRSDYEGTGMGLAICKKIVERHGGEITARSTPGQGSTFIVTLPVKGASTAAGLEA